VIFDDMCHYRYILALDFCCCDQYLNTFDDGIIPTFEILEYDAVTRARVELLPGLKFTGKMVKIQQFTGKIGKAGKR
jgi:hypothetical protein